MQERHILIVGAGFAGASAALRLSEHGIRSTIIEARSRIGGRVETVEIGGHPIDFGASNVHGYSQQGNPAQRLAESVGITLDVPNVKPGLVFGSDKKQIPSGRVAELHSHISDLMAFKELIGEKDQSLGSRVLQELEKLSPDAAALARTAELGAGIKLEDVSARYWKTERGFAGIDALPRTGYSEIIKRVLEKSQAKVILDEIVTTVEDINEGITLTSQTGKTYSASHAILTVPIAVLQTGSIGFKPALPKERQTLLQRTSVGLLDKCALLYERAWWPQEAGNFVFLPSESIESSSSSSPLQILDSHTIMVANMYALTHSKPPILLVYLPPTAAEHLERFEDDNLLEPLHQYIASRLQSVAESAMSVPKRARMVRWKQDPFARGATTSPIALGKDAQPDDLTILGEALWGGKLGFAGEGTDRHLRGSVPGAVASGEREADRIVTLLS